MSDDDGQGMEDESEENSDEDNTPVMYTTERTKERTAERNRSRTTDKNERKEMMKNLIDTTKSQNRIDNASSAGKTSTPRSGRRRRLATQPMTPDEKRLAQTLSAQRGRDGNSNLAKAAQQEEDDEREETLNKTGSAGRIHTRVQSAMQLTSPTKQERGSRTLSDDTSNISNNRSALSDDMSEQSSQESSQRDSRGISRGSRGSRGSGGSGGSRGSRGSRGSGEMNRHHHHHHHHHQQQHSTSATPASLSCLWGSGRLPGLATGERSPASMVSLDYEIFRGKRIVQVACGMGSRQAMYLTAGGDVYRSHNTFDENDAGIHDASTERSTYAALSSSPTSKLIATEHSIQIKVREPTLVQDFAWERALRSCTIVSVSCGAEHCCALADGGQVFTWGRASDGRLGLAKHYRDSADRTEVRTPKLVLPLLGKRIVDIQCGSSHTIVREASAVEDLGDGRVRCVGGRLFSWGKGESGQLGHGDVKTQPLPKEIKKGALSERPGVVSVGCGWSFTVAIHFDGGVSCWGRGGEGQLGTTASSSSKSSSSTPLDAHRPTEMIDSSFGRMDEDGMVPWCPHTVGCGKAHTIVLCQRHPGSVMMAHGLTAADMSRPTAVFSWGYGERGELGTQHALRPVPAQVQFPNLMPGDTVVSITTGSLHCAAVTQFGSVYVWGCNRHGALGVKNMNDMWVPVAVPMPSLMEKTNNRESTLITNGTVVYPIQVACGERCTIVLLDKNPSGRGRSETAIPSTSSSSSTSFLSTTDGVVSNLSNLSNLPSTSTSSSSLPLPSSRPVEMQSSISRHSLNGTRRSSFVVGSGARGSSLNVHQFGGFGENGSSSQQRMGSGNLYTTGAHGMRHARESSSSDASTLSTRAQASLSDHNDDAERRNSRKGSSRSRSVRALTDTKAERDRVKNLQRDSKIWQEDILPRWERTHEAPSRKLLRQQCARLSTGGVPPHLRRRVWPLLIANPLRITPELFEMYRERARSKNWKRIEEESDAKAATAAAAAATTTATTSHVDSASRMSRAQTSIGKETTLNLIDVDLPRTFPQLKLFDSTGPFHAKLKEVLETYACYRPDLGYVQGMSYIAALLCLYMTDTYQAFCCLANVMIDDNSHFFAFFNLSRTISNEKNRPSAYYDIFNVALSEHSKSLHRKMMELKDNGLEPSVYLFNWLQTAYLRILPLNVTSRVWDLFLIDGTPFLFRVGVALLVVFKPYLLRAEFEDSAKLLTNHPSKRAVWEEMATETVLFKQIDGVSLSRGVKEKLSRLISGGTR